MRKKSSNLKSKNITSFYKNYSEDKKKFLKISITKNLKKNLRSFR